MTRSVLEHDDKQRKSAADQMVRSENKIFCRKENQAILGAVGEAGVVGPEEGTKPRKVMMTMEEFEEYLKNN